MVSSWRTDGPLLLKWTGVAVTDRRLGPQHLLLTDLLPVPCPESLHVCGCEITAPVAEERGKSGLPVLARGLRSW